VTLTIDEIIAAARRRRRVAADGNPARIISGHPVVADVMISR
jgi:hypothetical protein